jgi:hypothetical protein
MKSRTMLAAVAVVALSLSGCVVAPGSGATPEEARERFVDILDSTQDVLGGAWDDRDDPTPRNCTIPLLVEGIRYPGLRLSEAPDSPERALSMVEKHWKTLELTTQRTEVGDVTELNATSPAGDLVIFRANSKGMTLQGESECRPKE